MSERDIYLNENADAFEQCRALQAHLTKLQKAADGLAKAVEALHGPQGRHRTGPCKQPSLEIALVDYREASNG